MPDIDIRERFRRLREARENNPQPGHLLYTMLCAYPDCKCEGHQDDCPLRKP